MLAKSDQRDVNKSMKHISFHIIHHFLMSGTCVKFSKAGFVEARAGNYAEVVDEGADEDGDVDEEAG